MECKDDVDCIKYFGTVEVKGNGSRRNVDRGSTAVLVVEACVARWWMCVLLKMHTIQVFLMDGSSRQLSLVSHSSTTVQQLYMQMMRVCTAVVWTCLDVTTGKGKDKIPYGITQFYLPPGRSDFLPLPYPEGCKAELT